MSPHTSCEAELQGSNTVLVQPGYDGGGSTGDMREGDGPGHHPMVLEGEEEERGPLKNKAEFILLLASLAVGTRSVIQYPTLAMRHGGGECQPVPYFGHEARRDTEWEGGTAVSYHPVLDFISVA